MTNPTSNFGWIMPDPTNLVTDLPADFEVFGQAVDTDFSDLLGGTTGQVLSKTSATDLDFTWITDATGMANPMTTTADIIYSSSGSTPARLGIGSTSDVLTVAGGVPTWAAPAGGGKVLQVINATISTVANSSSSTYADTGLTATITPTLASSKILVFVSQNGLRKTTGDTKLGLILLRSATTLITFETFGAWTGSLLNNAVAGSSANYLDSPATTSATTYKTQFASLDNVADVTVQQSSATSTITLMEIGA